MYVVNDDVIYRKVRLKDMKFGTSNDEDVKITGLQQAPKDICIAKSIDVRSFGDTVMDCLEKVNS